MHSPGNSQIERDFRIDYHFSIYVTLETETKTYTESDSTFDVKLVTTQPDLHHDDHGEHEEHEQGNQLYDVDEVKTLYRSEYSISVCYI